MKIKFNNYISTVIIYLLISTLVSACNSVSNSEPGSENSLELSNTKSLENNNFLSNSNVNLSSNLGKFKLLSKMSSLPISKRKNGISVSKAEIEIVSVQIKDETRNFEFDINPFTLDLLNLNTEFDKALIRAKIPAGSYSSIRLITAPVGYAELSDGTFADLVVPSGAQSGIKVFFDKPINIVPNNLTIATFYFDLAKSFVVTAKTVHFKPVVRSKVTDPILVPPTPVSSPSPSSTPPSNDPSNPNDDGSSNTENPSDTGNESGSGSNTDPSPNPSPSPTSDGNDTNSGSDSTSTPTPTDGNDNEFPPVFGV